MGELWGELILELPNDGKKLISQLQTLNWFDGSVHSSFARHAGRHWFSGIVHLLSKFGFTSRALSLESISVSLIFSFVGTSHRLPNHYRVNGYANRYQSNNLINRITVVTNNRNNTGIVTSGFYIGFATRQQHKYTWNALSSETKLCRKQAKIIQNHGNANVCNIGQGEPRHRKIMRLKLGGGQAYHRSSV
jgi:hypothetical protein